MSFIMLKSWPQINKKSFIWHILWDYRLNLLEDVFEQHFDIKTFWKLQVDYELCTVYICKYKQLKNYFSLSMLQFCNYATFIS